MKLAIVNGSPRGKKSNSRRIVSWIERVIEVETTKVYVVNKQNNKENVEKISEADSILIIFPLYTDSMPGLVKLFIEEMEGQKSKFVNKSIAFVIHSGFAEAIHSRAVERYVEYFAELMEMKYLGSVIMGASEAIHLMPEKFFKKRISLFGQLAQNIMKSEPFDKETLKLVSKNERLEGTKLYIMKHTRVGSIYWNRELKKNNAFDKRFDKPYL